MQRIRTSIGEFINLPTNLITKLSTNDTFLLHFLNCGTIEPKELKQIQFSADEAFLLLSTLMSGEIFKVDNNDFSFACDMYKRIENYRGNKLLNPNLVTEKEIYEKCNLCLSKLKVIFNKIPNEVPKDNITFDEHLQTIIILCTMKQTFLNEINDFFVINKKLLKLTVLTKMIVLYVVRFYLIEIKSGNEFKNHFTKSLEDYISLEIINNERNYYFNEEFIKNYMNANVKLGYGSSILKEKEKDKEEEQSRSNKFDETNYDSDEYYKSLALEYEENSNIQTKKSNDYDDIDKYDFDDFYC